MFHSRKRVIIFIIVILLLLSPFIYLYFIFNIEDYLVAKTVPLYPGGTYSSGVESGAGSTLFSFLMIYSAGRASANIHFVTRNDSAEKVASYYDTQMQKLGWTQKPSSFIDDAATRLYEKKILVKKFKVGIHYSRDVGSGGTWVSLSTYHY